MTTCAQCDRASSAEIVELRAQSAGGVQFSVPVHVRGCRKKWLDDAAALGTTEARP